jgi:hypothetical protein
MKLDDAWELKYGAFCVSFMLNASLSHFLPDSDSIFQLFYFIFILFLWRFSLFGCKTKPTIDM